MSVLFALLAAVGWGSSDFAAGSASRKSSAVSVVVLTHLASFLALVAISVVPGQEGVPGGNDLLWGIAAGFAGGMGAMLLFRGLGRGSMSVVAPVTATGAALVPAFIGVLQGESLGSLGLLGVVVAVGAIVLVSLAGTSDGDADADETACLPGSTDAAGVGSPLVATETVVRPGILADGGAPTPAVTTSVRRGAPLPPPPIGSIPVPAPPPVRSVVPPPPIPPWIQDQLDAEARERALEQRRPARRSLRDVLREPGMTDALLSGLGFGLFFVLIAQTSESAGHWPLVAARFVSAAMFAAIAIISFTPVFPERRSRPPVVLAGLLDAAAAVCFVLSTRSGLLSVAAVLASLYPAVTVLLARFVTGERITRVQLLGLVMAGVAVSLLAV